jgi:hypothetical protein
MDFDIPFLVTSFIFSLNSIQVVTDPSKGGHRDLPTNSVIGPEQVGQDPISYQKALIAEAWQVISRNRYENNRKATELLISQRIAAYAIISLLGFGLLLGVALCKERSKNPPEHHKQV